MRYLVSMILLVFAISSNVTAKDVFQNLYGNTIATFTDATEMLYRSFNIVEMSKKRKLADEWQKKSEERNADVSLEEVRFFLKKQGISASLLSQPLVKGDFAQLLFQRFKGLPVGFLTKSLQFKSLYFNEAQKLKIFSHADLAEETLTLTDMFSSFLKASKLANSFFRLKK